MRYIIFLTSILFLLGIWQLCQTPPQEIALTPKPLESKPLVPPEVEGHKDLILDTSNGISERVQDEDLGWEDFDDLQDKIFKSHDEMVRYNEMLSDPKFLRAAHRRLIEPTSVFDGEEEKARLEAVTYLAEVWAWEENPAQPLLEELTEMLLRDSSFLEIKDDRQKRSIAGDRIELIFAVSRKAPDFTAALLATLEDEPHAKVLDFAKRMASAR